MSAFELDFQTRASLAYRRLPFVWVFILALLPSGIAQAHGSVVPDEDLCIIEIGFYQAHFTIYQPPTGGHREYCEDVPEVTESVFVLEYLHTGLAGMPLDFRIIKDSAGIGRFAKWENVQRITNLEAETVFYQPARTEPFEVMRVLHRFEKAGSYIGIVTAVHPDSGKIYHAVFAFDVGHAGWGYAPQFLAIVLLVSGTLWAVGRGRKAADPTLATAAKGAPL